MNKYLVSLILLLFSIQHVYGKVFVPVDGKYVVKELNLEKNSINNISIALGFNKQEFFNYMDYDKYKAGDIQGVIFKNFSEQIICVLTKDSKSTLSQSEVDWYLENFKFKKEFDSYGVESSLDDGIKASSLSTKFFQSIYPDLQVAENGSTIFSRIGYELHFNQGKLVKFSSSDGLGKWGKYVKSSMPNTYDKLKKNATKHWGTNSEMVNHEINVQADALVVTPELSNNEYLAFHRDNSGVVNYKLLMVAHYDDTITLKDFKNITKGRRELVNEFNASDGYKLTTYQVNKCLFTFNEKGELQSSYTVK